MVSTRKKAGSVVVTSSSSHDHHKARRTMSCDVSDSTCGAASRFSIDFLEEELLEQLRQSSSQSTTSKAQSDQVIQDINDNLVGRKTMFESPFGTKAICYADYTASGRALTCIEDYIRDHVLPHYGNTHTTTSITGLQTTCFRNEARQLIAQAVNAKISGKTAEDCVLFTGQGSTSAINKMVTALGLNLPLPTNDPDQRPVVFVGPFEHHSNLLPWRESCAEVIQVPENADGKLDVAFLVEKLQQYAHRPLKIGSFSAASNLTGLLTDVDHISAVLHLHGALAFWDYATCAPYVQIDMNPVVHGAMRPYVYKDAVFLSGHKFVGGPGSPGLLICKKRLLGNVVPTAPGGGTVFFVTKNDHRYLSNKIEREEGGTPDIVGSIRLGLAFELKQRVHPTNIMAMEHHHLTTVRHSLAQNPNIVLLGRHDVEKLPIFSFLIRFHDRFLHFNFVCALLNDLFGIQTRGGCQCAGPYATRILGITDDLLFQFENAMIDKQIVLRAGFSRISFPYFMPDDDVEYILQALHFVANDGWKFLPLYRFNHKTGVWKHHTRFTKFPTRYWLSHFATAATPVKEAPASALSDEELMVHQQENLRLARAMADEIMKDGKVGATSLASMHQAHGEIYDSHYKVLRWFVYPSEAMAGIKSGSKPALAPVIQGPVQPAKYLARDANLAFSDVESYDQTLVSALALKDQTILSDPIQEEPEDEEEEEEPQAEPEQEPVNDKEEELEKLKQFVRIAVSRSELEGSNEQEQEPEPAAEDQWFRPSSHKHPLRSAQDAIVKTTAPPAPHFHHACDSTREITEAIATARVFPTPPQKVMKLVAQAVTQWNMIETGDRLLLGVSGGKDSLALIHILLEFQKRSPVQFKLACATVDPQTSSYDPSPLKQYMQAIGVPFFYLSDPIVDRAQDHLKGDSILAYTARMRRGMLYTCARRHKYNKLVLAHHLDDFAESFMMSAIHNGQLRTMKAKYWNDKKDVQVVRPLALVRESQLKEFAIDARLPVINENSPTCFEEPKERQRIKRMLSQEANLFPELYSSLRRAMLPLMSDEPLAKRSTQGCKGWLDVLMPANRSSTTISSPVLSSGSSGITAGVPEQSELSVIPLIRMTSASSSTYIHRQPPAQRRRKRDRVRHAVRGWWHQLRTVSA